MEESLAKGFNKDIKVILTTLHTLLELWLEIICYQDIRTELLYFSEVWLTGKL